MEIVLRVLAITGITLASLLALFLLLTLFPALLRVDFQGNALKVDARWLFLKFRLYPEKPKKPKKPKKPGKKKKHSKKRSEEKKKPGFDDIKAMISPVGGALSYLFRHVTIRDLDVVIPVESPEPARLALLYGSGQALAGMTLAFLRNTFKVIKLKRFELIPDFTGEYAQNEKIYCEIRALPIIMLITVLYFLKRYQSAKYDGKGV